MTVPPTLSIDERFAKLTDEQRKFVHRLIDKTDQDIAQMLSLSEEHVVEAVRGVMHTLGIEQGEYTDGRKALVELAKEFFNTEGAESSEESELPPSAEVQERALHQLTESPDLAALAQAIARFTPRDREVLDAVAEAGEDKNAQKTLSRKLGIQEASLKARKSYLLVNMGLPATKYSSEERLRILRQVLLLVPKERMLPEPVKKRTQNKHDAQLSVLPPLKVSESTGKTNGATHPSPSLMNPPDLIGAPAGHGLVIPLPANTVNVDVLSTEFSGRKAPSEIKGEIGKRRAQGLVPKFLVLIPTSDPKITQAHIVSVEEKK